MIKRAEFHKTEKVVKTKWIAISLILALSFLVTPAISAQDTENPEEDENNLFRIEEITVSANKINENIVDVPQSITVVSEDVIEEKGIKNIPELIKEIPNTFYSPNHGNAMNFRGLNTSVFTSMNPVVIYVDGVPYGHAWGFDASLVNVKGVEVLRGPQGTLYGKDAIGGVISVISKDPADELEGKVGAEYGTFNTIRGFFNVSTPISENKLYFGINGQHVQEDGWIKNENSDLDENANRSKDTNLSSYLFYKGSDKFNARLSISNTITKLYWEDGYALPRGSSLDDFKREDAEEVNYDVETSDEFNIAAQSLHLSYDLGEMTVTSTTTHRFLNNEGRWDADFGNDPSNDGLYQMLEAETDTWTQEVRLSSNNSKGFRWVAGLYVDIEKHDQGPYGFQFYDPTADADYEQDAYSETDSITNAVFGQVMMPLSEDWELTLGARYQTIKKEIELDFYYRQVGTVGSPTFEFETEKTWTALLPKAALSYAISDGVKAYASYSEGYMPGGFNYFASSGTEDDIVFEPQRSTNYEIGLKGSIERLNFSASVFHMDIIDIHVYRVEGGGQLYLAANADKAHSTGAEFEFTYFATDALEVSANLGVINAKYDSYDAGEANYDGEPIHHTPSRTGKFSVGYNNPKGYYVRGDIRLVGETYYFNGTNQTFDKADPYSVLDMKAGYRNSSLDIYLYGKNVTDTEYINGLRAGSIAVATFGDPAAFGAGASYKF